MESLPHTYPSHLTYPSHNHGYSLLHKTRAVEIWFLYCVNIFVHICFWTIEFPYKLCAYQLRVGKQVCIWMSANFRSIAHRTRSNVLLTHAVVLRARVYSISLACHTRLKHNSSIKLRVRIAGKKVILICNAPEGYTHSSLSDTYISPHLRWQYVMSFFTTSNFSCIKMHLNACLYCGYAVYNNHRLNRSMGWKKKKTAANMCLFLLWTQKQRNCLRVKREK